MKKLETLQGKKIRNGKDKINTGKEERSEGTTLFNFMD